MEILGMIIAAVIMIAAAVFSLRNLSSRMALPMSLAGFFSALWTLALTLEHYVAESSNSAKIFSVAAGCAGLGIAFSILYFGLAYPQPTKVPLLTKVLTGMVFLAAPFLSYMGLDELHRPTPFMVVHGVLFFGASLAGIALLYQKGHAAATPLRRVQGFTVATGFLLGVFSGGLSAFLLRNTPLAIPLSAIAPVGFVVVVLLMSRRILATRVTDPAQLRTHGVEALLFKTADGAVFREVKTGFALVRPPIPDDDCVYFYEDVDSAREGSDNHAIARFMEENFADAAIRRGDQLVVFHTDTILTRQAARKIAHLVNRGEDAACE